jgi:hypothetical protein
MPIKSFRGKIAGDLAGTGKMNGIDTIPLRTNNGSVGYRIKKFQLFASDPGNSGFELVAKIFSIGQTSATNDVDFSDNTLLASAYYADSSGVGAGEANATIVFDNMTFNQDITITMVDVNTTQAGNYYIELEQIKLDISENTVATLKDIRNIEAEYL